MFPSTHIRLTSETTPFAPAAIGAPFALVGTMAGVIAASLLAESEWPVVGGIALVASAVGFRLHRKQQREIARGEYRVGTGPVFGSCYLLFVGVLVVLFGVALARTYEPGATLFGPGDTAASVVVDLLQMLGVVLAVPLALAGFWLLPVAFVVGAAVDAGREPMDSPARPLLAREPWRSAVGVVATLSFPFGHGKASSPIGPAPLAGAVAVALAVVLAVLDGAEVARLAAGPALDAPRLATARAAARRSWITLASALVLLGVRVGLAMR